MLCQEGIQNHKYGVCGNVSILKLCKPLRQVAGLSVYNPNNFPLLFQIRAAKKVVDPVDGTIKRLRGLAIDREEQLEIGEVCTVTTTTTHPTPSRTSKVVLPYAVYPKKVSANVVDFTL